MKSWIYPLVIFCGLTLAAWLWVEAPAEPGGEAGFVASLDNAKRVRAEVERFSGKGGLLLADFSDWFAAQWHGRPLARNIALLTVLFGVLGWREPRDG